MLCYKRRSVHGRHVIRHMRTILTIKQPQNATVYKNSGFLIQRIIATKEDWVILQNYSKHLSNHRSEVTKDKCISLLLGLHQLLQEQEIGKPSRVSRPVGYICEGSSICRAERTWPVPPSHFALQPSSLSRYLRTLAKIRPYHRLKGEMQQAQSASENEKQNCSSATGYSSPYDESFANLVEEVAASTKAHRNHKSPENYIGPLRKASNQLMGIPPTITRPFYFELNESEKNEIIQAPENVPTIIDNSILQLLSNLLCFFDEKQDLNRLCLCTMFVAMILYGPKLRSGTNYKIDEEFQIFHNSVSSRVTKNVRDISFRSLAYLLNSCLNPAEAEDLLKYASERISSSNYVIPLDYLENICFALSRANFQDEHLYEQIAHMVLQQLQDLSPTVCLNLLKSYAKLDRTDLIVGPLEKKLGEFNSEHFDGLSRYFLSSSYEALKDHISKEALNALEQHLGDQSHRTAANP